MSDLLKRVSIPSLLITSTEWRGGKTVIAAAIATTLRAARLRVAVCKLCDTKCVRRREGLVSEDAEFLAACADSAHPLDLICPQRFADQLPPALCIERLGRAFDWDSVNRSLGLMSRQADVMIIEGSGGIGEPMDPGHTMIDVANWLAAAIVLVTSASPLSISQAVTAVEALRSVDVRIAGTVINRYPAESSSTAEETTMRTLERWTQCPVLAVVSEEPVRPPVVADAILSPISRVDWLRLAARTN